MKLMCEQLGLGSSKHAEKYLSICISQSLTKINSQLNITYMLIKSFFYHMAGFILKRGIS